MSAKTPEEIADENYHRMDLIWLSGDPIPSTQKLRKLWKESIEETIQAMNEAEKRDEAKRERDEEKGAEP